MANISGNSLNYDRTHDEKDCIPDIEISGEVVVLVSEQVQVLFHSRHICSGYVYCQRGADVGMSTYFAGQDTSRSVVSWCLRLPLTHLRTASIHKEEDIQPGNEQSLLFRLSLNDCAGVQVGMGSWVRDRSPSRICLFRGVVSGYSWRYK